MLNIACTQIIILAARKITCGKKGQEKKISHCYVILGVGMLNVMMIYHISDSYIAPNFCGLKFS